MRLYHNAISFNSRRALMTALHLDVKLDLEVVNLQKGEQRRPDMLRMNPNGKVPVLEDDGFVLWESHAIMQYLADRTPGQTVYPVELRARADVNRWLFWSANHWSPSVSILNWENFVKGLIGAGPPDPAHVKRGETQVTDCAAVLDAHLADKAWIAQDRLTLADLALVTPLMTLVQAKLPVANYPNLLAWFGRMQELDAWKKTSL
jgi:glutathione S-transferase